MGRIRGIDQDGNPGELRGDAEQHLHELGTKFETPVILPPGSTKLRTNPLPTGSLAPAITIGILVVAFCAALTAGVPATTRASGNNSSNSTTMFDRRSALPSAKRYSINRLSPST